MHKIRLSSFIVFFGLSLSKAYASLDRFKPLTNPYGNPNEDQVLNTANLDDPIRKGASTIADGIGGIKNSGAGSFTDAKSTLLISIQNLSNRVLGFLALITLIYLIIQGIQLLFNPKDDEVKKIRARLNAAARAIGGIGLSRLIVSFIFYVIGIFTN